MESAVTAKMSMVSKKEEKYFYQSSTKYGNEELQGSDIAEACR